jgi:hypothetical protein
MESDDSENFKKLNFKNFCLWDSGRGKGRENAKFKCHQAQFFLLQNQLARWTHFGAYDTHRLLAHSPGGPCNLAITIYENIMETYIAKL